MADHADSAIIHGQRTLLVEVWRLVDDLARWRESGGYCRGSEVSSLHAGTVIDDLIALRGDARLARPGQEWPDLTRCRQERECFAKVHDPGCPMGGSPERQTCPIHHYSYRVGGRGCPRCAVGVDS